MTHPQIKTLREQAPDSPRLAFRRLAREDAESVFAYGRSEEVTRYLSWAPHASLEDSMEFVQYALDRYEADKVTHWPWALVLKETGAMIGCIGAGPFPAPHNCVEIGYVLGQEHWGKGLMTEALAAAIEFLFDVVHVNRVQAHHFAGNEASGRVMEKAGLLLEGRHSHRFYIRGQFRDAVSYALCRRDAGRDSLAPTFDAPILGEH